MEVKDKLLEFIETSSQSSDVYFERDDDIITIWFTWKDRQENLWDIEIAYYLYKDEGIDIAIFKTPYEIISRETFITFLQSDNMSYYLFNNLIQTF